jgi:hypothetical protein
MPTGGATTPAFGQSSLPSRRADCKKCMSGHGERGRRKAFMNTDILLSRPCAGGRTHRVNPTKTRP